MKKLFILFLLLITSFLIAQEEIILDTPYEKEISITIPKSEQDKIDLIKRISELYWAERYDHEKTLEREEKLINNIEKLKKDVVNPLMDQLKKNETAIKEIADIKVKKETFKLGVFIETSAIYNNGKFVPGLYTMPYIQLFETLNIGLIIGYPFQLGVGIGVLF
jgi:hypothetical protein